ncbi:hypothetical protein SAMN06264364_11824 [Quadrisphaera granulorum]|uniref:DUF8175 domain-containing protein n=1 Tax=Quadrisphaera granulorum TaxID=317664 RepID=A0A316A518_9ACTN|nr:hypothetical protein BXY45_11824 [Quadrisphaera granulorum]SZE97475.1 hypothetical protein SAMN06264364_11824 [Quadrisphaera granulorum]
MTYARAHDPARQRARRRRTQIAVLGVIAIVFPATALSAWNVLRDGESASSGPPAIEQSAAPDPSGQSPAPTSSSDLTWVDHDGTPLPVSATAGPTRQDGPLDVGYADTDLGAAVAALNISYAASAAARPEVFRAALDRQVTGPGRDALEVYVERDYAGSRVAAGLPDGAVLPAGDGTAVGYRVTALPAGNRHVQLVVTAPAADGSPQVFSADVVMTWSGGDWKLVAPTEGTWDSAISQLSEVPGDLVRFDPPQPAPASLGGDD